MPSTWKAPADQFDYALDFTPVLVAGEAITTIVSISSAQQPGGTDSTAEIIGPTPPAIDGAAVVFWLQGGNLGEQHQISVIITTDQNREYTGIVNLDIQEF